MCKFSGQSLREKVPSPAVNDLPQRKPPQNPDNLTGDPGCSYWAAVCGQNGRLREPRCDCRSCQEVTMTPVYNKDKDIMTCREILWGGKKRFCILENNLNNIHKTARALMVHL